MYGVNHEDQKKLDPAKAGVIGCCLCLNIRGKRVPATTIVKGYAVCDSHIDVAARHDFDLIHTTRHMRANPV